MREVPGMELVMHHSRTLSFIVKTTTRCFLRLGGGLIGATPSLWRGVTRGNLERPKKPYYAIGVSDTDLDVVLLFKSSIGI